MIKKLCLLLFLFPALLFSQKNASAEALIQSLQRMKDDTLKVNQLIKISDYYTETDTAKALFYGQKAVQLSKELAWSNGLSKANFHLANMYSHQHIYKKALVYFKQSLNTNDSKSRSKSLQNIGEVYLKLGDFSRALDYCFKALKINETIGNKKANAKVYANLGSVYFGFQKYAKALEYYNLATQLYDPIENGTDLAIVNRNIAGVYNSLKQPTKALYYYEKANLLCKNQNNKTLEARILSDISLS